MTDLVLTTDSELMVTHIESQTEAGQNFLDAYVAPDLVVIDSGRIIIPQDAVVSLVLDCERAGLTLSLSASS